MEKLNSHNSKLINSFISVALILSILGLGDTIYLAIKHYEGLPVNCVILEGCDIVTTSSYSVVFGIPLAVFGVIYYLSLFILLLWFSAGGPILTLKSATVLVAVGFLFSLYLTYLQIFVIGAICIYCVFSATATTLILVLCLLSLRLKYE